MRWGGSTIRIGAGHTLTNHVKHSIIPSEDRMSSIRQHFFAIRCKCQLGNNKQRGTMPALPGSNSWTHRTE